MGLFPMLGAGQVTLSPVQPVPVILQLRNKINLALNVSNVAKLSECRVLFITNSANSDAVGPDALRFDCSASISTEAKTLDLPGVISERQFAAGSRFDGVLLVKYQGADAKVQEAQIKFQIRREGPRAALTNSLRVIMLIRLMPAPAGEHRWGAN